MWFLLALLWLCFDLNRHGSFLSSMQRGWNVDPAEQKIYFATANEDVKTEIPSEKIIKQTLNYARELERIV